MKYLINLYTSIFFLVQVSYDVNDDEFLFYRLCLGLTDQKHSLVHPQLSLTGLLIYVKAVKQDLYFLDQLFSFQKIRRLEMRVYILSYTVT